MSHNSGELIYNVVKKEKEDMEARGISVVAIVADNASGIQNAIARIESEDPSCVAIRCAAHSFQLLLHDLESTPLVRAAMATTESVITYCSQREVEEKLKDLQKAAGKSEGKLPLKPVETRWSTKIYAMEVLLELRSYINLAMEEHPGEADWSPLAKAVDRLRPLASATEEIEMDNATLSTVLKHVELVKAHWSHQSDLTTFHGPALSALAVRCEKHFGSPIHLYAKALHPDSDLIKWSSVERNKLSTALVSYFMPVLKKLGCASEILPTLRAQFGQWVARRIAFSMFFVIYSTPLY